MKVQRLLYCMVWFVLSFTIAHAQSITISGTVYNDGTEGPALGTPTNVVGDKPIYAILSKSRFGIITAIDSVAVSANGTYAFINVTTADRPAQFLYYYYQINLSTKPESLTWPLNAVNEGARDYHRYSDFALKKDITIGSTDQTNVNFSFNQLPTADSVTAPNQTNPNDGTTQVPVPALTGFDPEDGIYDGVSRTTTIGLMRPTGGALFYMGSLITTYNVGAGGPTGDHYVINNYDPTKLTVRPDPGTIVVSFKFNIADAANRWGSDDGTVTMPFTSPEALYDYGDIASTLENASSPAHHLIVNGLHIGQLIDSDTGPFTSTNGDDLDNLDDEDGIINNYPPPLSSISTSYSITVNTLNSLGQAATLNCWIDFNNNGAFEISERAQTTVASNPANMNVVLSWSNLPAVSIGNLGLRLRLATNASEIETPYGLANSGEVEDYVLTVNPRISGRILSDGNGMTDNIVNGTPWQNQFPIHINTVTFDKHGAYESFVAHVEADGTFSFDANSNRTYNLVLRPGNGPPSNITINKSAKLTGGHTGIGPGNELIPYYDFNNSDDNYLPVAISNSNVTDVKFGLDQYPIANNVTIASQPNPLGTNRIQAPTLTGSDPEDGVYNGISGVNTVRVYTIVDGYRPIPGTLYYDGIPVTNGQLITNYNPAELTVDPKDGNVTVTFQYRQVDAIGAESRLSATVTIPFSDTVSQLDFGDASDTYSTSLFNNGPRHTIVDGLRLGTLIDAEGGGQFNGNQFDQSATGDNINGVNDEDGITSFPTLFANQTTYSVTVAITNTTGADATLSGWIDFNRNQTFSNNERTQVTVPTGATSVTLTWTNIPWSGSPFGLVGDSFARFRLASVASEVDNPTDQAYSGEVEDYAFNIQQSAFPVDLTHFEGRWLKDQGNQLSWSTAWERDNDRFEIQRSSDAKSFESIGHIMGKGRTTAAQTYTFVDDQPLADLTYYRLKQVDTDGYLSYSKIISIRQGDNSMNKSLLIYPNPTTDLLQVQVDNQQSIADITIYNVLGRRVLHQVGLSSTVNVQSLPASVYVLEVKTLNGQMLHQRFVKQ